MVNKLGTKEKLVDDNEEEAAKSSLILVSSSDDDEANKDLSLQIVEKARLRKREKDLVGGGDEGVIDLSSSSCEEVEGFVGGSSGGMIIEQKKKRKPRKKKKNKKVENKSVGVIDSEEPNGTVTSVEREPVGVVEMEQPGDTVNVIDAEEPVGIAKMEQPGDTVMEAEELADIVKPAETAKDDKIDAVEIEDNIVLRKLLRGPRYFDPPDRNHRTCYHCDEEGHNAANCTSKRRKKPCFICGSSEHGVRNCSQGKDCFVCKKQGHRAKDCPDKHQMNAIGSKICLRCGDVGHLMFSCSRDYDQEDLKEIQCYVCKRSGHLCCVDFIDLGPGEVSCYNCGQSGHIGAGCAKQRGEVNSAVAASTCFRCGEKGHIIRNCTKPKPSRRSNGELSTPRKGSKKSKELLGVQSAPPGPSKVHEKQQTQNEERDVASEERLKRKWCSTNNTQNPPSTNNTQNPPNRKPEDNSWKSPTTPAQNHLNRKPKDNSWKSPVTPASKVSKIPVRNTGSHPSNSQSPWTPSPHFINHRTPNSHGSSYPVQTLNPTYAPNPITPNSHGFSYSHGYPRPPNSHGSAYPSAAYPNMQTSHGPAYPRTPASHGFANSNPYHHMYNTDPRYNNSIGSGGRRNYW